MIPLSNGACRPGHLMQDEAEVAKSGWVGPPQTLQAIFLVLVSIRTPGCPKAKQSTADAMWSPAPGVTICSCRLSGTWPCNLSK